MLPRANDLFPSDFKFTTPIESLPQNWFCFFPFFVIKLNVINLRLFSYLWFVNIHLRGVLHPLSTREVSFGMVLCWCVSLSFSLHIHFCLFVIHLLNINMQLTLGIKLLNPILIKIPVFLLRNDKLIFGHPYWKEIIVIVFIWCTLFLFKS